MKAKEISQMVVAARVFVEHRSSAQQGLVTKFARDGHLPMPGACSCCGSGCSSTSSCSCCW